MGEADLAAAATEALEPVEGLAVPVVMEASEASAVPVALAKTTHLPAGGGK